jgi:hypothetical protein
METENSIDNKEFVDTIDVPEEQQTFTFTYVIGEDKNNGTSTNTK